MGGPRPGRSLARVVFGGVTATAVATGLAVGPGSEVIPLSRPAYRLAGDPGPTGLDSAANLVRERAAALARVRARVTAASAALAKLQTQAELVTERYDHALADEQQAAAAYRAAVARLAAAQATQQAASGRLARHAAADFESQGSLGQMATLLGGAGGPGAYLNAVSIEQVMADHQTDSLVAAAADSLVMGLFRAQARDLLAEQRAELRELSALRVEVTAAVGRQLAAVQAANRAAGMAASQLAGAKASQAALEAEREAALAASAAASGSGVASGASGPTAWPTDSGASAGQGEEAANWALSQLGKPYQWGGTGPGSYDCSGLAMDAWTRAGIALGHWTGWQWTSGPHIPIGQLRPGDLVFYATNTANPSTIHHVGIYLGGGMMVDAPYTGAVVRIDSIHAYPGLIGATRPGQ